MFCSNCGKTLRSDASTCPHCKATVGESRFEGQPYTGAQIKTKPGEAVFLPANHTKTTYMGSKSAMDQDVDARTTYRATNEQVYAYDEADVPGELYNEDVTGADNAAAFSGAEDDAVHRAEAEEEAIYDDFPEPSADMPEETETEPFDEPVSEAAVPEEEADPGIFEDNEEYTPRRERKAKKARVREDEDEDDQKLIDALDDKELEELKEALNPTRKKVKKHAPKPRKKTEEELIDEEAFEEIRARKFDVDDEEALDDIMRKYEQSGRYDRTPPAEEPKAVKESARVNVKDGKKEDRVKKNLFAFMKKREENFELAEEEESFEEIDDENAFNLNDLPEMEENYVDDAEYPDEEITDEELEAIELEGEDIEFDERRKKLSPKAIGIIKYACAAVVVVAVLVGVIMGLSYITDKTKKAPIEGVTYDLYMSGIELMQYRASDAYQNDVLSAYDGLATSMIAITARISDDLDSISKMMPEDPDLNDARFIDALEAIQGSINNSITNDMLAVSDSAKTVEAREAESAARWQSVRDMVTVLTGATSTAQLDAIIKGERVEVIQQATPEPAATNTPVPYTTLASGSEGAAVRRLQNRLADLGFLDSEIDGDFGKKTKTAVQLFQQAAGLEVTGIADENTQIALFDDNAPKKTN